MITYYRKYTIYCNYTYMFCVVWRFKLKHLNLEFYIFSPHLNNS